MLIYKDLSNPSLSVRLSSHTVTLPVPLHSSLPLPSFITATRGTRGQTLRKHAPITSQSLTIIFHVCVRPRSSHPFFPSHPSVNFPRVLSINQLARFNLCVACVRCKETDTQQEGFGFTVCLYFASFVSLDFVLAISLSAVWVRACVGLKLITKKKIIIQISKNRRKKKHAQALQVCSVAMGMNLRVCVAVVISHFYSYYT